MNSYRRYLAPLVFCAVDYMAIVLAVQISLIWRNTLFSDSLYHLPEAYVYGYIPLGFLLFLAHSKAYQTMQPYVETMREIFWSIAFGFALAVFLLYFTESSLLASRFFVVLLWLTMLVTVYVGRTTISYLLKRRHLLYEPLLLIGAGKTAEMTLHFFSNDLGYRYDVVGIVDDAPVSEQLTNKYRLYGSVEEAATVVKRLQCQNVIITAPGMEREKLADTIAKVQPYVRNISYVPDLIGTPMAGVEAQVLFSEEILLLHMKNNLALRRNRIVKRVFDLVLTICGGIVILPFILVLAFIVAIDNKGRVIFAHRRVGKKGRLFLCYKFQTMVSDAQEKLEIYLRENPAARREWEESFKLTDDPRVTKLGSVLRRTSLDELPQLWNVICGDMSLVGPRPIVTKEIERYGEYFREYSMVLPGITGMWQASGRSDTTYEERVVMDTWYVRNWSLWIDIYYLAKTVKIVFTGKGAY
ncbi:MAG: undecaprenyl-phosphate galactose phosphotransferase WbaP [Selenomonadaceae bacterium]|nr:undecaprenyl-phosphate galactose phosphotransferase WbaP [Selenomonadaceae bacterium]